MNMTVGGVFGPFVAYAPCPPPCPVYDPFAAPVYNTEVNYMTAGQEFPGLFEAGIFPGSVAINRNIQLELIGTGAGSEVYKVYRRSGYYGEYYQPLAMKKMADTVVNETTFSRFYGEASIMRRLNHPNIVAYHGSLRRAHGDLLLFMELADCCLTSVIEGHWNVTSAQPFAPFQIMMVAHDIASALSYLHFAAHLLHGDIKSSNIVLTYDMRRAKLCDFGLAVPVNREQKAYNDAQYCGTSNWMAPEVICRGAISDKTDMFSYGLIIWEMLALHIPHMRFGEPEKDKEDLRFAPNGGIVMSRPLQPQSIPENFGTRPAFPKAMRKFYQGRPDYNDVATVFFKCTEVAAENRPSAAELTMHMGNNDVQALLRGRQPAEIFQD